MKKFGVTNCATELNKYEEKWIDLLSDRITWCSKYELFELIDYIQSKNLSINTLSLQCCVDGSFIVKIDNATHDYYKNIIEKTLENT